MTQRWTAAVSSIAWCALSLILFASGCELIAGIDRDLIPGAGTGGQGGVGATGGGGDGGQGATGDCTDAGDCGTDTTCKTYSCNGGTCSETNAALGTTCTEDGGEVCDANGECVPAFCMDTVMNGNETGVDCGGDCEGCPNGDPCTTGDDCENGYCDGTNTCAACGIDGDCNATGDFFCSNGVCTAKGALGAACVNSNQCVSSNCSDGLCCDAPCAGGCDACSIAAGATTDGNCETLPQGDAGNPSCAPYLCDGADGDCPTTCLMQSDCSGAILCVDNFCCNEACSEDCRSCAAAETGGDDGICSDIMMNLQGGCPAGQLCDGMGACKLELGEVCGMPSDCLSGNCVDGVCCDTICDQECQACDLTGTEGTCSPEADMTTCAQNANFCDGAEVCMSGMCTTPNVDPCDGEDGDDDCSETCDEVNDNCDGNDSAMSVCNDGLFCTATEECDGNGACLGTANACLAGESCDEAGMTCFVAWINEFHYENISGDVGEFVEVAANAAITDPSLLVVTFYDGGNQTSYDSVTMAADAMPMTVNGITVYDVANAGIQNGAPDGIALSYDGTLIEFISYEGSFMAMGGVADGVMSTDVGVAESSTTNIGDSLSLMGSGLVGSAFTWEGPVADTPGTVNTNQMFQ